MDSMRDSEDFWARLDLENYSTFEDASDLSRYSVQTHRGQHRWERSTPSKGFLRLAGQGVHGHQVDAYAAFQVGISFQKLITSFGSALSGAKSTVSKNAEKLTRLRLDGSPAPGSIVFNLVAGMAPDNELRPNGEFFDNASEQLIDRSFDALHRVLSPTETLEDQEHLASYINELGPQAAKSLRSFVTEVGNQYFDLELKWQQPLRPTLHWSVPTINSQRLRDFIAQRSLDAVPVTLRGRIHTASLGRRWIMLSEEYGQVQFDLADLSNKIVRSDFPAGQEVEVNALMTLLSATGQRTKREFRVTGIRRL